jgi:ABC-type hemin transport system ATPase subunit
MNQALLLKGGKVMATGSPKTVFTSENMTNLFDFPCRAKRDPDGWHLVMDK